VLRDDRLGRSLRTMFGACGPEFLLAVTRQCVREFDVSLDELHNDSTTVSFHGAYAEAAAESKQLGRPTAAITWGHSKARRPDLKQLLYTLTISSDGAVPVYFTTSSGNTTDDTTHRSTWDFLKLLVGSADFLYVADCKLASQENLNYIAASGGRFITIMPRTWKDDAAFRAKLRTLPPRDQSWQHLHDLLDDAGQLSDRLYAWSDECVSSGGFRLLWYRSTEKAVRDQAERGRRLQRAFADLEELRARLAQPKTRLRERAKVEAAIERIREERELGDLLRITVTEQVEIRQRQASPGRPTKNSEYVEERKLRYELRWEIDDQELDLAQRADGAFPLVTNERKLSPLEVLRVYRRQPMIEKRFAQLKTDFNVAPVFLKDVTRIQGLLAMYFLALLAQALLERELRRRMKNRRIPALPIYPEERDCRRPSARRVFDLFEPVLRHHVTLPNGETQIVVTELTEPQRQVLALLDIDPATYGQ
jgi:transposase